jgi:virginiamycin A acetyltransferase
MNENIIVGKHTYFSDNPNLLWAQGSKLILGKYCSVATGLKVYLHGNHYYMDRISTYPEELFLNGPNPEKPSHTKGDIIIGNDVWIGANVVLMSGTKIGNGAIIGAYSVVRKEIRPYSVAYGNPCCVQHMRFPQDEINKLEEMKWWDWDESLIPEFLPFILNKDVEGLYNYYLKRRKENVFA